MKHTAQLQHSTEADCCNQREDANDDQISFRRADYLYSTHTTCM